jgi:pimeloyl-ACP methyl ester carboxylesterase
MFRTITCLGLAALVALCAAQATYDPSPLCTRYTVQLELVPGLLPKININTFLCSVDNPRGKTLILSTSGGTYGSVYFDLPYQRYNYSFVEYMARAGYAVLNWDRPGNGESDKPVSQLITIESEAYVTHQLIQLLRSGGIGNVRFPKIVHYCHSLGCAVLIEEAATYGDVNGLVITGFASALNGPGVFDTFAGKLVPVQLDPSPRLNTRPVGYFTTTPGARTSAFVYVPNVDPMVSLLDEATKEIVTDGELATFATIYTTKSRLINVPVFEIFGRYDAAVCTNADCASLLATPQYDPLFWSRSCCYQQKLVPDAGHGIVLQRNSRVANGIALEWINRRFGADANAVSPGCSAPNS